MSQLALLHANAAASHKLCDVVALWNNRIAQTMAAADSTKKVLVVVTNWDKLGETGKKTGW